MHRLSPDRHNYWIVLVRIRIFHFKDLKCLIIQSIFLLIIDRYWDYQPEYFKCYRLQYKNLEILFLGKMVVLGLILLDLKNLYTKSSDYKILIY